MPQPGQQGFSDYVTMYNPLGRSFPGGRLAALGFAFDGTFDAEYHSRLIIVAGVSAPRAPARHHSLAIVMANRQGTAGEWRAELDHRHRCASSVDRKASRQWWNAFWQRSFVEATGPGAGGRRATIRSFVT